jgi:hypothetical protein
VNDARPWTHAALFGALWGAAEASLGTLLHLTPWFPAGLVMSVVGVVCLVTARRLAGRPGVTLLAGVVAAVLVVFSVGGLKPGAVIGILACAGVLELTLTLSSTRAAGAIVGGAIALVLAALQKVLVLSLIVGSEASRAYVAAIGRVLASIGLAPESALGFVVGAAIAAAFVGALAGAWAWRLAGRVARRVGVES